MLDLVRAFHGSPSSAFCLHTLCLPTESLLVSQSYSLTLFLSSHPCQLYPSADTVVILDATSLRFIRALAFSQVFPGASANYNITSLAVDPALRLVRRSPPSHRSLIVLCTPSTSTPHIQVVAASGPRLAVWSLSGVSARTWLVHSSLVLPDDKRITAIDCSSGVLSSLLLLVSYHSPCAGLLVVATQSTLSVHTLVMENDLPTWSSKWSCRSLPPFYSLAFPSSHLQ